MLAMTVGPRDMRRGVETRLRAQLTLQLQPLLLDAAEEEPGVDAMAVKTGAEEHPEEDAEPSSLPPESRMRETRRQAGQRKKNREETTRPA